MRIARFSHNDTISYGILHPESDSLEVLRGDPLFTPISSTGTRVAVEDVRLLSPVIPRSKVVGVGRNYAAHAAEMGNEVPAAPILFFKPNTAVVGPYDPIVLPPWSTEVHFEAELAVVISRMTKNISAERAADCILGYTVANDVSARDIQRAEPQWARAKGFDTSCPLGPYLLVGEELGERRVRARLNGEQRQDGTTADMILGVHELVAYISRAFTLLPGDVILTGTPAGVGQIRPGDRIECEVEGIGATANPVVASE